MATTTMTLSEKLMTALSQTWTAIQKRHPDVPNVMITVGSGTINGRRNEMVLGHFAVDRWKINGNGQTAHELFVGGEGLARGAEAVLATLLHEAAHGAAKTRREQDTSRGGRYHNRKFQEIGHEFGLEISQDGDLGYSHTEIPARTVTSYRPQVTMLKRAIKAYRRSESDVRGIVPPSGPVGPGGTARPVARPKNGKNYIKLQCECTVPRTIRASAGTAEVGMIRCDICNGEFRPV